MTRDIFNIPSLLMNSDDLETEKLQCEDEGKSLDSCSHLFKQLSRVNLEKPEYQAELWELLDQTAALPVRENYPYIEPSDIMGIRDQQEPGPELPQFFLKDSEMEDKIYGAWLGRCAGCLLGKPVEGWRRERMWGYLGDCRRVPLSSYFRARVSADIRKKYEISDEHAFIDNVKFMPEDDDLNFTVASLALMKKYGHNFTPRNVAEFWLHNIPIMRTCTAERVAYRNFCMNIPPPLSASFRNPYREWIGAQIRGDFYGYVFPGNPARAAEFAWRDACISHVKNGIYGAMWVAGMISAAFTTNDIISVIESGLCQVPFRSRLREAVFQVLDWYMEAVEYDQAVERLHRLWDEEIPYDWCHVISNAMVVTIGLLWGGMDFGRSICRAVQACFDTDCNGATVGSILGVILGAKKLPKKWIDPLNDTLESGVFGFNRVKISDLARDTLDVIDQSY